MVNSQQENTADKPNTNYQIIDLPFELSDEAKQILQDLKIDLPSKQFSFYLFTNKINANQLEGNLRSIKEKGFKFQVSGITIYWSASSVMLEGAHSDRQKELIDVLQRIFISQKIINLADQKAKEIRQVVLRISHFEKAINLKALSYLKEISEMLFQIRRLNLLLMLADFDSTSFAKDSERILFNEIASEELEIEDIKEIVVERIELLSDFLEEWQEKLIEYRSFIYEAALEIIIIVAVAIGVVDQILFKSL